MASQKQIRAAKRNIVKARQAAKSKKTILHLPKAVRTDLSRQAAKSRARGGKPGRNLEDRTRQDLYEVAARADERPHQDRMGGACGERHGAVGGGGERVAIFVPEPLREDRDERQPEQEEQVRPHRRAADPFGRAEQMMVIVPVDPDDDE